MSAPGNQPQSPTPEDRDGRREQGGRDALAFAQDRIALAVTAMREAGAAFRNATQPAYTSSVGLPIAVQLSGTAARTAPVAGTDLVDTSAVVSAYDTALAYIGEYAAVRSGTLSINGQSFEVEPSVMTLRDVVDALNHLADVSASLDETSGRVNITSRRPSSPLAIADASHVLDAVGISAGSYMPGVTVPALVKSQSGPADAASTSQVAADASAVVHALNRDLTELVTADGRKPDGAKIADALETAAAGLRREGIGGLSVKGDGAAARLALNQQEFVNSLSTAGAGTERGGPLGGRSSGFELATRLRTEMAALLDRANGRRPQVDGHSTSVPFAATAPNTGPAAAQTTRSDAPQPSPAVGNSPGHADRQALQADGSREDDPLQRGLLPLGDDELSTF